MQDKGQFDKPYSVFCQSNRRTAGECATLAFTGPVRHSWCMFVRLFSASDHAHADPCGAAPAAPAVTIAARPGQSLSQAIWLSGLVRPLPLCGGLGRCGRCRVRFMRHAPSCLPAEEDVFSASQLEAGWRLACRRQVPDPDFTASGGATALDLELPSENLVLPAGAQAAGPLPGLGMPQPDLALAVDLGTTSLCWRALDMQGRAVAEGRSLNPQAGAGADVMSRLAVARAPEGRTLLAGLARRQLLDIMDSLVQSGAGRVTRLCLAANTAMTDIFLDRDVEGLCAAPYRLAHKGDETVALPDFPPVYVPPLSAPFVGGDLSAGLAALLEADVPRPFVLADLGTNGELALVTETGQLWLTSVPLGPALEGIGPECGQLAGPGVVTGFTLTPMGLAAQFYEGASPDAEDAMDAARHHMAQSSACPCPACQSANAGQSPAGLAVGSAAGAGTGVGGSVARGISATGYLSLLALLLRAGVLRNDGQFVANPVMPLARKLAAGLEQPNPAGEPPASGLPRSGARLRLPHGLWLAAADVEALLQVKAAFALALDALLRAANIPASNVAAVCLAGTLGEYVRPDDLETLGFVPAVLAPRIRAVGNTALDGAALLALHSKKIPPLARMCREAVVLPLVDEPNFHTDYLRRMRFGV
ncbi:ASKHA domain-containing protein [Desulfovibrio sp.]|uniref:ASKHA domain-containing protein n=1 Tax=Desulfovibrio sp. TaxID=885 RepID=UPI0025B9F26C|nr:ASKHA domain-containing protein [Desulfovibrio sp.]